MIKQDELTSSTGLLPGQKNLVLRETEFVLAHPSFKNSKRCVALLRHLVDHSLTGDTDGFKERTLGIEVFGREPDYDTNADPVIRMTANEIRKRLAQCYQEPTPHSVKIRLVSGTYVPQFDFDAAEAMPPTVLAEPPSHLVSMDAPLSASEVAVAPSATAPTFFAGRRWVTGTVAALLLLIAALAAALHYRSARGAQTAIWEPILSSEQTVTVCVGEIKARNATSSGTWAETAAKIIATRNFTPVPASENQLPSVPLVDVGVAGRVTRLLAAGHRESEIRGSNALTLNDLRHGPVVLVGVFDNPWTLILLSNLRFHMRVDPATQEEWVEDAQDPSKRNWKGSGLLPYASSSVDYALITRVLDPETGQWLLAIGGLGMHGTEAAADLVLDPANARLLSGIDGSKKNFQILLSTSVIGGHPGPPQIVAVHSW